MKKQLTRIAPLKAGIVLALLYGMIGIIAIPVFLLFSAMGVKAMIGGAIVALFVPFIYAVFGFISGVLSAAIYNLVANITGGLEFEVRDLPPGS